VTIARGAERMGHGRGLDRGREDRTLWAGSWVSVPPCYSAAVRTATLGSLGRNPESACARMPTSLGRPDAGAHGPPQPHGAPCRRHWTAANDQTRPTTRQVLWPPKPSELLIATSTRCSRASLGT